MATIKNIFRIIIIGVIIVVVIGYCVSQNDTSAPTGDSSSGSSPSDQSSVASRPLQTYTAEQLYAMFHANEVKANQTIGNAIVRFTGIIASIEQSDFSKTAELQILGQCFDTDDCEDPNSWNTFEADLKTSELSEAAKLTQGQTITLQCDSVSMPFEVSAQGCVIARNNSRNSEEKASPQPTIDPAVNVPPPPAAAVAAPSPHRHLVTIPARAKAAPMRVVTRAASEPSQTYVAPQAVRRPFNPDSPAVEQQIRACIQSPAMAEADDVYRKCLQQVQAASK